MYEDGDSHFEWPIACRTNSISLVSFHKAVMYPDRKLGLLIVGLLVSWEETCLRIVLTDRVIDSCQSI
jgi:hypothetical protein